MQILVFSKVFTQNAGNIKLKIKNNKTKIETFAEFMILKNSN